MFSQSSFRILAMMNEGLIPTTEGKHIIVSVGPTTEEKHLIAFVGNHIIPSLFCKVTTTATQLVSGYIVPTWIRL